MKKTVTFLPTLKPIALAIMTLASSGAFAQNLGFEDSTTTGWTGQGISAVGSQTLQAGPNNWTVNPYGTYMGKLSITTGTFSEMVNGLNLTQDSISGIQSMLVNQAQTTGNGQGKPTTAAWTTRVVTLTAGQTFTLAWQYISTDYVPFNDGSIATLVKVGDPSTTATLNNYNSQYALLGFTNPGTGDYSTGSYGATGWQTATFTAPSDGDYILGFGVFNLDDMMLNPVLFVDEIIGTTLQNGQPFGPIAPNPGTLAPNNSGPTLISNVTNTTTGTDVLDSGNITVNNGVIQLMLDGATLTQLFDVQPGGMTIDQNSNSATIGGVISGSGNVIIANSGNGGSVTFTEVNTYTGSTTINQGATLTNNGSIASSSGVTNNGTFVNNGAASDVTNNNSFTNSQTGTISSLVNNGTATNSGTITGSVTNSGTLTNSGTTGDWVNDGTVNNSGTMGNGTNNDTFNNSGTTGTVNNTGTFTNNATGTTGDVTNSGTFNNSGTTGVVANNGTFTNAGTTGDWINDGNVNNSGTMGNGTNNGTFTNGGVVGTVNNTGTFINDVTGITDSITNSGTFNNSGTTGAVSNSGEFTNAGTTGDWVNTGVVTNSGTMGNGTNLNTFTNNNTVGTVDNQGLFVNGSAGVTGDITNSGVAVNEGTMGSVTNNGTLHFVSGTISSITNSGTLDLTSMSNSASLGSNYTQTTNGTTVIYGNQQFYIPGVATLAGNITILDAPTSIGKYTYLTAGSVVGRFDSLIGSGGRLVYTADSVQLWVMPDGTVVQAKVDGVATSMNAMNGLASGSITGMVGSDCTMFGKMGYCASINYGVSRISSGDLGSSGITLAKSINDNWRVGVFGNKLLGEPTVGTVKFSTDTPAMGAVIGWRQNKNGRGFGASLSAITGSGDYTIGTDKTGVRGDAVQARVSYTESIGLNTNVSPYFGVRYSRFKVNGFTEEGPIFPLTYDSVTQTSTDLLAGVTVSRKFLDKLSASTSLGIIHNVRSNAGSVNVSSDMGNFSSPLIGSNHTSAAVGLGMNYSIAANQSIGFNVGWVQRDLNNVRISSAGVSYTIGF
jgi:hypothetical protein